MAHGAPDYSNVVKPQFTYRVDDLGEIAARLNNKQSPERAGETILIETFKNGLARWSEVTGGTGSSIALVTDRYVSDGFSCFMVGGSDDGLIAELSLYTPYLNVGSMGFEFRVRVKTQVQYIAANIRYYDGTEQHYASLLYYWFDNKLGYLDENGVVVYLAEDIDTVAADQIFGFIKVTADFENSTYLRGKWNEHNFDMSDIALKKNTTPTDKSLLVQVRVVSLNNNNGEAWVDNLIITRNE